MSNSFSIQFQPSVSQGTRLFSRRGMEFPNNQMPVTQMPRGSRSGGDSLDLNYPPTPQSPGEASREQGRSFLPRQSSRSSSGSTGGANPLHSNLAQVDGGDFTLPDFSNWSNDPQTRNLQQYAWLRGMEEDWARDRRKEDRNTAMWAAAAGALGNLVNVTLGGGNNFDPYRTAEIMSVWR